MGQLGDFFPEVHALKQTVTCRGTICLVIKQTVTCRGIVYLVIKQTVTCRGIVYTVINLWGASCGLNTCNGIWASACDFQQFGTCDQQRLRPACAYAQSDQSLCYLLEYSMIVKLLTEHHLELLGLKGGYTGSSESTHVKKPHCWKSHALAHIVSMALSCRNWFSVHVAIYMSGYLILTFVLLNKSLLRRLLTLLKTEQTQTRQLLKERVAWSESTPITRIFVKERVMDLLVCFVQVYTVGQL